MVVDGITSAFGLAVILDAQNPVGWMIAVAGGLSTTGFSVATRYVWDKRRRGKLLLRTLWLLAVFIDIYTTVMGTYHFVIEKKWFDQAIDPTLSGLANAPPQQVGVAIALTLLISGSPIAVPYAFDDSGE